MTIFRAAIFFLILLLTACSSYDGLYQPACIAYEGDKIHLTEERFEWQRFTDQISVDENGEVVEPFPDYPKTGRYFVEDERLVFVTDDGVRLSDWFLLERLGVRYLLTYEQNEAFLNDEGLPDCALKLVDEDS